MALCAKEESFIVTEFCRREEANGTRAPPLQWRVLATVELLSCWQTCRTFSLSIPGSRLSLLHSPHPCGGHLGLELLVGRACVLLGLKEGG